MKPTELELKVMSNIIKSDYNDGHFPVGHQVWSQGFFTKEQTGACSSCVKKGWVGTLENGRNSTIWVTKEGLLAYLEGCSEEDRRYVMVNWPDEVNAIKQH